ncbi:MAG TPA: YfiR family protein [Candidatus Binatia bacterium]|nr:YfiR family protein [Candidatus Binatia bacterium]
MHLPTHRQARRHAQSAKGFTRPTWLLVWPAVFLVLIVSCSSRLAAQNPRPTQYEVEAAYLFNFGKFVRWPERDNRPPAAFQICILGEDPFGAVLDKTTAGERLDGRQVVDRRIARPQDTGGCSILYISGSEAEHLTRILATVKDAPVLTVSDIPGFVARGGMIEFVVESGRVRFLVNLAPAEQDGLMLSSELLKVAVRVTGGGRQENR